MKTIQKIGVYFVMLAVAAFIAGIYGMVHDQISYTFSAEYFTQFKFKQFGIAWAYDNPRLGAAYVGAMATWWVGALIFIVLGSFGFMFSSPLLMIKYLAKSFCLVITVALVAGFLGLAYGYYSVNEQTIVPIMPWVLPGVTDPVQFVRVGFMHNASYLGGIVGLLLGIFYLIFSRLRYHNSVQTAAKITPAD